MSRSGYSDDFGDGDGDCPIEFYRQAVRRATNGARGQTLLRKLRDALDAMPVKRLITGRIKNDAGEVCALGALDPNAQVLSDDDWDDYQADTLGKHFGIATALAAEIVYMNDEWDDWRTPGEAPEQRWTRMRAWVDKQILKDDKPAVTSR